MEANTTDDKPFCFICHHDDENEPLLCGVCSCRGGSGHSHLSCMVEHGKIKLDCVISSGDFDVDAIRSAWWECCTCKQFWRGDMLAKMADEFAEYAQMAFPDHPELQVEVLRFELEAAAQRRADLDEQYTIATDIISAIDQLTVSGEPLSLSLFDNLRYSHDKLAHIALERGDAARAVEHYTECRIIIERVEKNEWSLMKVDVFIANARARMLGVDTVSSMKASLGLFKKFYDLTKKQYGNVSQQALNAGDLLCGALMDSEQFIAYERQCAAVFAISCQLHGVEHLYTEDLKWNLEYIHRRCAVLRAEKDQPYEILEYDASGDKYLLKRIVDEGEDAGAIISASASDLTFCRGTPVVCHGLTDDKEHLNGLLGELKKNHDNQQCTIHFEDESLPPLQVKRENVSVVFELPPI